MGQITVDLSSKLEVLQHEIHPKQTSAGVAFPRYFTARLEAGKTPYEDVQWETRTATIGNDKGSVIFEQRDIEVPSEWSQTATNIVASKYFHGKLGSPDRERSVAELVHRVVDNIANWGIRDGYFRSPSDGISFRDELAHTDADTEGVFQFSGVVQRRGEGIPRVWVVLRFCRGADQEADDGSAAAVLGVLYRFGEGFARVDPGPRQDGRHAVQVGIGDGVESVEPARGRRDSVRARLAQRVRSAGIRS